MNDDNNKKEKKKNKEEELVTIDNIEKKVKNYRLYLKIIYLKNKTESIKKTHLMKIIRRKIAYLLTKKNEMINANMVK